MGTQTTSLSVQIPQLPTFKTQNHRFLSSHPSSLSTSNRHLTLPSLPTQWNTPKSPPSSTLRVRALKSQRKPRGVISEDEEDEEDEEGIFLPFGKMREWLERKPSGFGEGKVYDTSIEDKLLDEMSLSRRNPKVGSFNKGNLKKGRADDSGPTKAQPNSKESVVADGVRVRVLNLPKKKNIHRDLKAAFGEFPGLVSIVPAVSGNKKTKDPICKGIALVDLTSEEDAARFVQQFSGQIVAFGKIQKQIKCQLMNSQLPRSSDDDNCQLGVPNLKVELDADLNIGDSAVEDSAFDVLDNRGDEFEDSTFDAVDDQEYKFEDSAFEVLDNQEDVFEDSTFDVLDDECEEAEFEDETEDVESLAISEMNIEGRMTMEPKPEAASGSRFSNKQRQKKKKVIAKGRQDKSPNLGIPGSAKRLKFKEKAVLTGVLSKYASNAASATK